MFPLGLFGPPYLYLATRPIPVQAAVAGFPMTGFNCAQAPRPLDCFARADRFSTKFDVPLTL